MRRLLAAFLAAALLLVPGTAGAQDRLDRVAAGLAKDPVFVDPDMTGALTGPQLTQVRKAVTSTAAAIGRPVYLVVIPDPTESESGGRSDQLLWNIHTRVGKDGLYLTVDDGGYLSALGYRVPREIDDVPWKTEAPGDVHHGFADLPARLSSYLAGVRSAPAAAADVPQSPYPETTHRPSPLSSGGWQWDEFFAGLVVLGPLGAFLAYWLGLAVLRVTRRRRPADLVPGRPIAAPSRPRERWARATAAVEVAALGRELDEQTDSPGRSYALTAYDAAQLLLDGDTAQILDLVGVIVLARLGRTALENKTAKPGPPCFVNPLHGPGRMQTQLKLPDLPRTPRRRPVCDACFLEPGEVLRGPGGRPHYTVPGIWQDTGFGTLVPALAPRVLEHLGVD